MNKNCDTNTIKCHFCNNFFSSIHNLNKHLKSAKYCIFIQNNRSNLVTKLPQFKCEYCDKISTTKYNNINHIKTCKYKFLTDELNKEKLKYENEIKTLKAQINDKNTIINSLIKLNNNCCSSESESENKYYSSETNNNKIEKNEFDFEYINIQNLKIYIESINKNRIVPVFEFFQNIKKNEYFFYLKFIQYFEELNIHFENNNDNKKSPVILTISNKEIFNFFNDLFDKENRDLFFLNYILNNSINIMNSEFEKKNISSGTYSLNMYKFVSIIQNLKFIEIKLV
jgi:hypothetical protein